MRQIRGLVCHLETFYNDVVMPQLSVYETEYTKKEKNFDKRIDLLKQQLSTYPLTHPAEILDPAIYNINDENDDCITIIDDVEVAE